MTKTKPIAFEVDGETGCFNVTSHRLNNNGYPRLTISSKCMLTHRFIWEQCFGEIPDGMFVCHKCDNPACINPEHLFLGTHTDNMHDMKEKGRAQRGESHHRARLTEEEVKKIRNEYVPWDKNHSIRVLAKKYKIGTTGIFDVVRRKSWVYV